jgi:lysophospholipase L1-like esterase
VKYIILLSGIVMVLVSLRKEPMHRISPLSASETILAVGDSLTYGYGAPENKSYPSILSQMLSLDVINAGQNGELSREGLQRLPALLRKYRPALTIICYGGNDILQKRSMSQLKKNLKKMIELCRAEGSEVLLVSVPNMTLFGLEPLELYEEIGHETNTPLLSGVLAKILEDPSLKSDQVHPNAKGYEKLAEEIYGTLKHLNMLP